MPRFGGYEQYWNAPEEMVERMMLIWQAHREADAERNKREQAELDGQRAEQENLLSQYR